MVVHSLVLFAAEAAEKEGSKVAFYVFGLLRAGWAVAVSVAGIRRPDAFAQAGGARSGVVAVSAVLVVGACLSAALTG
jgi:hypothetical protein